MPLIEESEVAKKTTVIKSVPADKVAGVIKALKEPPAAENIKQTDNKDGTFDIEATVTV